MGKLHRIKRKLEKQVLSSAVKKGGVTVSINRARRILRGYVVGELGELRSTLRKLTEQEIIGRVSAKAIWEIQRIEDARVFADLDRAASFTT